MSFTSSTIAAWVKYLRVFLLLIVSIRAISRTAVPKASAMPASAPVVLYDGALGGTPDTQGMLYQTFPIPASATQSFANGMTTLDTTPQQSDQAGYFAKANLVPSLDRTIGYVLSFNVQVVSEAHTGSDRNGDGVDDRAGFSVILLSSDKKGIELGFWQNEIWAQADGAVPPGSTLFTHAEGAAFDTTSRLIAYRLTILGNMYMLSADNAVILSGNVRDYTAFIGPIDPYETPNLIFLGDDTNSAKARINLSFVSVATLSEKIYLPVVLR
jgi:hypothetical protein